MKINQDFINDSKSITYFIILFISDCIDFLIIIGLAIKCLYLHSVGIFTMITNRV